MQSGVGRGAESLEVRVLGPLAVLREDREVDLAGPLQRAVLAALVAADGRPVSAADLVAEAWGEPTSSLTSLRSYLSRLRKALGEQPGDGLITRSAAGYALRLAPGSVDADQFLSRVRSAEEDVAAGAPEAARDTLSGALDLWRGAPYADVVPGPSLAATVAHLEQARLASTERLHEVRIGLGQDALVVADLERHVRQWPTSERGWILLATALYRTGRQVDALGAIGRARTTLVEEFGLDPGPELQLLETSILRQDRDLGIAPVRTSRLVEREVTAHARSVRTGPPLPLTPLVGRVELLAELGVAMAEQRVVTLTGPGGAGKTRLAIELVGRAAEVEASDGDVAWVALADVRDPDLVPQVVADALGVSTMGTSATVAELLPVLRGREALVVLDNCEQVAAAVARLVVAVLSHCPGVRFLATSRELLRVPSEVAVQVGPLESYAPPGGGPAEAVQLFLARAHLTGEESGPSAAMEVVEQICRELDGNALAIELAAARTRTMSPAEIASALKDRFDLLTNGSVAGPRHHRTLRETVSWSYDLLDEPERRVLRTVAVFDGFFLADAVSVVDHASATGVLQQLAEKSLLAVDRSGPTPRWSMPETIRLFALDQATPHELHDASGRHLEWIAGLAREAAPHLRGAQVAVWLGRLSLEEGNIRRALTWAFDHGRGEDGARLAAHLWWYWYRRGHTSEGRAWMERALVVADGAELRARLLDGVGLLSYFDGDLQRSSVSFDEAAALAEGAADRALASAITTHRGYVRAVHGDLDGAMDSARAGLEIAVAARLPAAEAEALMALGQIARFADLREAERVLTDALELAFPHDAVWVGLCAQWILAKVAMSLGDAARAVNLSRHASSALISQADHPGTLAVLQTAAGAVATAGDTRLAARLLGAVDAVGARIGYSPQRMEPADSAWLRGLVGDLESDPVLREAYASGSDLTLNEAVSAVAAFDDGLASRA